MENEITELIQSARINFRTAMGDLEVEEDFDHKSRCFLAAKSELDSAAEIALKEKDDEAWGFISKCIGVVEDGLADELEK